MDLNKNRFTLRIKNNLKKTLVFLFGNSRYQKVIIVGQQRTGSTLLASYLNSHPALEIRGEPFRLLNGRSSKEVWNKVYSRYLPWRKYVGFRLFYYHPEDCNDRQVWSFIENDPNIIILHIQRRNILRSYVSKEIAQKTGVWNSILGSVDDKFDKKVEIDFDKFAETYSRSKKYEKDFGILYFKDHPYMEVIYEELIQDSQDTMDRVFKFLGLKPIKVRTTLKRQNPEKLKDLIKNYDEIESKIISTTESPELKEQLTEIM